MKKLIYAFLFLSCTLSAQLPFNTEILNQDLVSNLRDVHFVSSNVGYSVDFTGKLIKTLDGGDTWSLIDLPESITVLEVHFTNENVGYVVGGEAGCSPTPCTPPGERIYKTTNGGDTWINQIFNENLELSAVDFYGNNFGIAAGLGKIHRTLDGTIWTAFEPTTFYNMQSVKIVNNNIVYIGCLFGTVLKSSDGGLTWTEQSIGTNSHVYAIDFINENIGIAVGQEGIFRTTNGGDSWQLVDDQIFELYGLQYVTDDLIIAVGKGQHSGGGFGYWYGSYAYSLDGGLTWEYDGMITNTRQFSGLHFPNGKVGYAVGLDFNILKFEITISGTNDTYFNENLKIFPNPTSGRFTIQNQFEQELHFQLYNAFGQELQHGLLRNDEEIDVSKLASGVYQLVILERENHKILGSKKLIVQ